MRPMPLIPLHVFASGNFPPFQVRGEDLDSYTVDETNGEPDDMVSLMMNGRPSAPFSVNDLDQAKV